MNKKHLIFAVVGISLFIFGMTFVIPGGDRHGPDIDVNELPYSEACTILSGEQAWNEVENSCLLYGDNADLCNGLGGKMRVERECTTDECFIECLFPIEIIDT
ncbi:MAG: hypothetical protein MAG458_01571 [Nitrosopumilus sp.]|nr:hypothetical protein [Nitrosopumilus sp.]